MSPAVRAALPPRLLEPEPARVAEMFSVLAPAYDRFNRLSSLGLDGRWRKRAAAHVRPGEAVLDLGCGTGDLALAAARRAGPAGRVDGADFSAPMLDLARVKAGAAGPGGAPVAFHHASADALPFPDAAFDIVVSAFVLRSLARIRRAAAAELRRVLRPGGRAALLELTRPGFLPLRWAHRAWLGMGLPLVGRLAAGPRWPGAYLADTILAFPEPSEYAGWFTSEGLECDSIRPISGGIACLIVLRRP